MFAMLSEGSSDPHTDTVIVTPKPGVVPDGGEDTTIILLHDQEPGVPPTRRNPVLGVKLYSMAVQMADEMGEMLHSATFWVTDLPEVVTQRGLVHDCEDCRTAVTGALAHMAAHPGCWVAVGLLRWADSRRAKAALN